MDFVSNIANKAQLDSDHSNNLKTATNDPDLFSSAKVVASAAHSQFRSEQYDRQKAAGAGADLLDAASNYGKLDSTQGVGKYVDQAEGYLRQYNTNSTGTETTESQESAPAGDLKSAAVDDESGGPKSAFAAADGVKDDTTTDNSVADGGDSAGEVINSAAIPTGDADKERGGGVEEFEKKAEEFLSKESGDGGEDEKNGDYNSLEEYEKKAEGFLSKESGDGDEEEKAEDYNSLKEDVDDTLKKMPPGKDAGDYAKEAEGVIGKASDGGEKVEAASETQSSGGGGGFGNVMKMAGGFLNK